MDAVKQRNAAAIKLLKLASDATQQGNLSLAHSALQRCLVTASNDKVQARALFRLGQLHSRMGDPDSAAICFLGAAQRDNTLSATSLTNMHLCMSKVVPMSTLMTVVNDVHHSNLLQNAVEQALTSSITGICAADTDPSCGDSGAECITPAVLAIGEHSGWVLGLSAVRALARTGTEVACTVPRGTKEAGLINQVLCVVGSSIVKEIGNIVARSNDVTIATAPEIAAGGEADAVLNKGVQRKGGERGGKGGKERRERREDLAKRI